MKKLWAALIMLTVSCGTQVPVALNPDKATATSGTAGSAKFTDAGRQKDVDTMMTKTDTAIIEKDSTAGP